MGFDLDRNLQLSVQTQEALFKIAGPVDQVGHFRKGFFAGLLVGPDKGEKPEYGCPACAGEPQGRRQMGIVGPFDPPLLGDLPPRLQARRRDVQPRDPLMPVIRYIIAGLPPIRFPFFHQFTSKGSCAVFSHRLVPGNSRS